MPQKSMIALFLVSGVLVVLDRRKNSTIQGDALWAKNKQILPDDIISYPISYLSVLLKMIEYGF